MSVHRLVHTLGTRFARTCGARWDRYTCQLPAGHSGQHQSGVILWQNLPRDKQPPSDWRSRPPKGWEDQQDPPDDVPDHDED